MMILTRDALAHRKDRTLATAFLTPPVEFRLL